MGKERRAFQGVFMPRCIWLNNELKPSEKMLLTEINSLDTQKECFASNDHFTTFLNVSKGRVSQMISHLKDLKYINVKLIYKPHSKEIDKRVITVNQQKFYGITPLGNEHTPLADYLPPLGNAQDNISINKSINKKTLRQKHKKRVYDKDSDYYKLSEFFVKQILNNNPNFKKPNIQKWSDDFRIMIERDRRDKHQVAKLIVWVQHDSFWMSNVLSPTKLRDKYDSLVMRMANSSEQRGSNSKEHISSKENDLKDKLKKEAEKKIKENEKENAARRTRIMQGSAEQA